MKKNMRNALAISGLALAMGTSALTLEASANNGSKFGFQRSHQERILKTRKLSTEKIPTKRLLITGTVSEINLETKTITVIKDTKAFTVNASDARILGSNWQTINFSSIAVSHKIKVSGTITDTAITAKTIRDLSLS
ncbi:MAG: hypothetical protein HGA36_04905 [Candidatus Moranbacteria bacterium]|nr:hypothetical protein [Candidatus Moranbacteria bacterium]